MSAADPYVMGRTAEETERIRQQSALLDAPTGAILDRAELAPGASCLDVGCGPGDVMRQMGEHVGPGGRVTGFDIDAEVGLAAAERLNAAGPARYAFVPGDVVSGELPPGRFALVFARLLLLHLPDPVAALRRMWDRTAPGGMLAIIDFDLRTITAADSPIAELGRVSSAVFAAAGLNHNFGATIPAAFARAGIGAPDGTEATAMFAPLAEMSSYLAATYRSLLPTALEIGATDEARSTAFLADMEARHGTESDFVLGPLIVSAWKRKPHQTSPA
jgi:ubiquinone/menaquinone biosynthesis C-methylase UbiE